MAVRERSRSPWQRWWLKRELVAVAVVSWCDGGDDGSSGEVPAAVARCAGQLYLQLWWCRRVWSLQGLFYIHDAPPHPCVCACLVCVCACVSPLYKQVGFLRRGRESYPEMLKLISAVSISRMAFPLPHLQLGHTLEHTCEDASIVNRIKKS